GNAGAGLYKDLRVRQGCQQLSRELLHASRVPAIRNHLLKAPRLRPGAACLKKALAGFAVRLMSSIALVSAAFAVGPTLSFEELTQTDGYWIRKQTITSAARSTFLSLQRCQTLSLVRVLLLFHNDASRDDIRWDNFGKRQCNPMHKSCPTFWAKCLI